MKNQSIRIGNIPALTKLMMVKALDRHIKDNGAHGKRHLLRYIQARSCIIEGNEWISFTQYESILICYRHYYGINESKLDIENLVIDNRKLGVLDELGD